MISDWSAYRVLVFAPYRMTRKGPESVSYGTAEFKTEVAGWMKSLGVRHTWVEVTPPTCAEEIVRAQDEASRRPLVVFNLCDGIDIDGYPGVKTVRALERSGLAFTGADAAFYELTTPKTLMKARFLARGVATSPFVVIKSPARDGARAGRELGYPLIVKPDVSASSFGISIKSVVQDEAACIAQARAAVSGERDPDNYYEGVFAERFIPGREFTALCVADRSAAKGVYVYPPVERVFHAALPPNERLLSYDRYWERYEIEAALPGRAPIYRYDRAPKKWTRALVKLARDAYLSLDGVGYGRVDIRLDERTGDLLVLEANCNCGLSTDGETSVSWILQLSGETMPVLLNRIFNDAVSRIGGKAAPQAPGRPKKPRSQSVRQGRRAS